MDYRLLGKEIQELAMEESWYVSLFSNVSALLYEVLPELNWAGFYLMRNGCLALGPFQGKTACIHIPVGRGVCGTAVLEDQTIRVADVHEFPGHIACDSASESEIVIPVHAESKITAVLDIDSPIKNRFTEKDQAGLESLVKILEQYVRFF